MEFVLEATAGPIRGQRLPVVEGQILTVGRTNKSKVAIPEDRFLSGIHFAVERRGDSCILVDRGSSNGTFVNGTRVTEVALKSGDEVRAGDTIFVVRLGHGAEAPAAPPPQVSLMDRTAMPTKQPSSIPSAPPPAPKVPEATFPLPPSPPKPPAPQPASSRSVAARRSAVLPTTAVVGNWSFSVIPPGWEVVEEYGIQETGKEGAPSSAMVSEELLPGEMSLEDFVQSQVGSLRQYLREPRIERSRVEAVRGAEDTVALDVRYKTKDGQGIFYRSVYVRRGDRAGLLTLKTLEADLPRVKPIFDSILSGVSFRDRNH